MKAPSPPKKKKTKKTKKLNSSKSLNYWFIFNSQVPHKADNTKYYPIKRNRQSKYLRTKKKSSNVIDCEWPLRKLTSRLQCFPDLACFPGGNDGVCSET